MTTRKPMSKRKAKKEAPKQEAHTPGPAQADARLIAAAQDLLAACEAMMEYVAEDEKLFDHAKRFETPRGKHAAELLRAAIAKAKGGAT